MKPNLEQQTTNHNHNHNKQQTKPSTSTSTATLRNTRPPSCRFHHQEQLHDPPLPHFIAHQHAHLPHTSSHALPNSPPPSHPINHHRGKNLVRWSKQPRLRQFHQLGNNVDDSAQYYSARGLSCSTRGYCHSSGWHALGWSCL